MLVIIDLEDEASSMMSNTLAHPVQRLKRKREECNPTKQDYPFSRWKTGTKSEAVRTEGKLLDKFDYPWNESINGTRRPDDVLQRLKGIKNTGSSTASNRESISYKSRNTWDITDEGMRVSSRESVSYKSSNTRDITDICGATTCKGTACRRPPVPGRVRCAVHEGMRVRNREFVSYESSNTWDITDEGMRVSNRESISYSSNTRDITDICGATTCKGTACRRPPVPGRVRCAVHEGMRVSNRVCFI